MAKIKTYLVGIKYIEYDEIEIEAENKKEARQLAEREIEENGDYGGRIIDIEELQI